MSSSFHRRIKKDIELIKKEPVDGILVETDHDKLDIMYAVIVGPKGTPYEGGFFYFVIRFPEQYPMKPPNVKFMTSGNGNVRFNPNLYTNGKVCVSILGTWSGPGWQPIMSLRLVRLTIRFGHSSIHIIQSYTYRSVLLSLQTLLNEEPAFNEPGINKGNMSHMANSKKYNEYLVYETIRVGVLDMIQDKNGDSKSMPESLRKSIKTHFLKNFNYYDTIVTSNSTITHEKKSWFSSSIDAGMFGIRYCPNYKTLKTRLESVRAQVTHEMSI